LHRIESWNEPVEERDRVWEDLCQQRMTLGRGASGTPGGRGSVHDSDELAQLARAGEQPADAFLKRELVDWIHPHTVASRTLEDRLGLAQRRRERLLDENVAPVLHRRQDEGCVRAGRRTNVNDIDLAAVKAAREICERSDRGTKTSRQGLGCTETRIDDGDNRNPEPSHGIGMPASHQPSPDDRGAHGLYSPDRAVAGASVVERTRW
jgi:hypothetical protein